MSHFIKKPTPPKWVRQTDGSFLPGNRTAKKIYEKVLRKQRKEKMSKKMSEVKSEQKEK